MNYVKLKKMKGTKNLFVTHTFFVSFWKEKINQCVGRFLPQFQFLKYTNLYIMSRF